MSKKQLFFQHPILLIFSLLLVFYTISNCCVQNALSSPLNSLTSLAGTPTKKHITDHPVAEESQTSPTSSLAPERKKSFFSKQYLTNLQVSSEAFVQLAYWRLTILNFNKVKVFNDIESAIQRLIKGSGYSSFLKMIALLGVVFIVTVVLERIIYRLALSRLDLPPPSRELDGYWKIWGRILDLVPDIISLLVFIGASYLVYVLIAATYFSRICPFYLSILVTVVFVRSILLLSRLFFAPSQSLLRLTPLDTQGAKVIHRSISVSAWFFVSSIMIILLLKHGGLQNDSLLLVKLFFGSLAILITAIILVINRESVEQKLRGQHQKGQGRWVKEQFAKKWHYFGLGYLFLLWVVWAGKLILAGPHLRLGFIASLLIFPIFLIFDSLVGWYFSSIERAVVDEQQKEDQADEREGQAKKHIVLTYLRNLTRLLVIGLLLLWILQLWGVRVSLGGSIQFVLADILLILVVSFVFWKLIDKLINSQMESDEEETKLDEEAEGEWGGGALLNRSQTLLPIVRKFIGIVMIVMVIMLVLSSLGVNIGPLLAGAGVIGIAIGFGAQKLVSDVLSGFFYLLDDAFRVGEYIEAGTVTGAVEKISLRNVMLRHHRGMLQIVPHSDLGAITNFMRGAIVVKFNLQFPYDTDVDVVRKVIKRVGIEMLDDPEFGKDFIQQVKSQGIREVGDSILTIRAKFSAKPGTHFVIRREAYRRITEALAAKGIHYAHRKVIVEVPSIAKEAGENLNEEQQHQLAQSGAAAAHVQQQALNTPSNT